ncbi:MAG TPA: histidine kinase [Salinibacter sp.]|nr:histidine kinase [Salinibacter sp.]
MSASTSSAFVQALLDCAWDLFAVMGANGRIRYLSPSNERLLGYEIADLVGQNGFDLLHPDDRPLLDDAFEQLRRNPDEPVTLTHRFRAADGAWRTLESTLQNKLAHPVLSGWVVHSRDVTDRDTLHAELERTRQTLRRLQLHPHFVLNVLHTIQTQVLADPEAAAETIADFGDLLRLSYAHVDTPMVPLGHEVDFVERYVDLYRHRFGTPITATFDVPDSLRTIPVPSLLLQPLVENALLHGLRPAQGGRLTVRARSRDEQLRITVLDDGVGIQAAENRSDEQVGLATTRTRLRQMYGTRASLQVNGASSGGTIATIGLPLEDSPAAEALPPSSTPPDGRAHRGLLGRR